VGKLFDPTTAAVAAVDGVGAVAPTAVDGFVVAAVADAVVAVEQHDRSSGGGVVPGSGGGRRKQRVRLFVVVGGVHRHPQTQ